MGTKKYYKNKDAAEIGEKLQNLNGEKLPPCIIYGKLISWVTNYEASTETDARNRYGNFTISRWLEHLTDNRPNN